MDIRRSGREKQRYYIRDVGRFATFRGRSPDTATVKDVRRFQIEQGELNIPAPTMNAIVSALRFFFTQTLDQPDLARKLPVALSRDEVARLLDATTCLKHQAALSAACGAGLRASEAASLKMRDIDSERMLLRVERGKGGRYRNGMLPTELWRCYGDGGGSVSGGACCTSMAGFSQASITLRRSAPGTRQPHRIVAEASVAAGIGKRVGPHTFRHCFATHLRMGSTSASSRRC